MLNKKYINTKKNIKIILITLLKIQKKTQNF